MLFVQALQTCVKLTDATEGSFVRTLLHSTGIRTASQITSICSMSSETVSNLSMLCIVTTIEYGRKWAYRAVRDYLDSKDAFMDALVQYLRMRNQELRPYIKPLSDREVCGIAKSVCKWTWKSELRTKSQEDYDKTFSKIQKARSAKGRQKSIATRQKPYQNFVRQVND